MLIIYAWVPFGYISSSNTFIKIALSVLFVMIAALIWARYAAPKSSSRLSGWSLVLLKGLIFVPAAVLIGLRLGVVALLAGIVLIGVNLAAEYVGGPSPAR